jgi:hypothetical protein
VSLALIVLAVLPHQIPESGRHVLEHPIGTLLFASVAAWVTWKVPVLGAAMFLFLAGVRLHGPARLEPFAATNLNKERVPTPERRWLGEELMSEEPHAIQERTENPNLSYDKVTDQESEQWLDERMLDEHPYAIQDKAVGTVPEYDEGGASYGHR